MNKSRRPRPSHNLHSNWWLNNTGYRQRDTRPRPDLGATWWLRGPSYFLVFMRELTSVFITFYLILFIGLIAALYLGEQTYNDYMQLLWSAPLVALQVLALLFALFHTVTWFNLTPKAVRILKGESPIPSLVLVAPLYLAWLGLSSVVLWIILS